MEEVVGHYLSRISIDRENAFHSLIEQKADIVPYLVQSYKASDDLSEQGLLLEVICQYQSLQTLDFLAEVLQEENPRLWKTALDGIVTIGGSSSIDLLTNEIHRLSALESPPALHISWLQEALEQIS